MTSLLLHVDFQNDTLSGMRISDLWKMGYGTVSNTNLINIPFPCGSGRLMLSVLVANTPQVILSFLYLTYNGLFSCMMLMEEWTGFAHEQKPLRVTFPIGSQRSSYWLQIPYKYGILLLVMFGTLHWLVSQSIFLARVSVLNLPIDKPKYRIHTLMHKMYHADTESSSHQKNVMWRLKKLKEH